MDPRQEAQRKAQRAVAATLVATGLWQAIQAARDPEMRPFLGAIATMTIVAAAVLWVVPIRLRRPIGTGGVEDAVETELAAIEAARNLERRRRALATVSAICAAIALGVGFAWPWAPRIDFDMLGILWLLVNIAPLTLVGAFGITALVTFSRWVELTVRSRSQPGRRDLPLG